MNTLINCECTVIQNTQVKEPSVFKKGLQTKRFCNTVSEAKLSKRLALCCARKARCRECDPSLNSTMFNIVHVDTSFETVLV